MNEEIKDPRAADGTSPFNCDLSQVRLRPNAITCKSSITKETARFFSAAMCAKADPVGADLLKRSMADRDIVVGTAADGTNTVEIKKTPFRMRKRPVCRSAGETPTKAEVDAHNRVLSRWLRDAKEAMETYKRNERIALEATFELFSGRIVDSFKDQVLAVHPGATSGTAEFLWHDVVAMEKAVKPV